MDKPGENRGGKNKLLMGLGIATAGVLLVLLGFLAGSFSSSGKVPPPPQTPTGDNSLPPPPPPPPVTDEVRVKENLEPGRTYRVNTSLAFNMRGTDRDWAIVDSTITINYWAIAEVDRFIESNDGRTIVERRTFRGVKSSKFNTQLKDVRISLGPTGSILLGGVALLKPDALPFLAGARQTVEGMSVKNVLVATGLDQTLVSAIVERDPRVRVITKISEMEGKVVRLTYQNDKEGRIAVEPLEGTLTSEEHQFLASSVLLADSLIFPDVEIRRGESWTVNSMYFIGLVDPSLMVRPEGSLTLQRASEDRPIAGQKQRCVPIQVTGGELRFRECTPGSEETGHFRPEEGELVYAPDDHIIIEGHMKGGGKLTIRRDHHLLFTARGEHEPDIDIRFTCRKLKDQE